MELSIDWWSGRLGNNLIQVFNLILFCKKHNLKCIQKLDHPIIGKFEVDFQNSIQNFDSNFINHLEIIKGARLKYMAIYEEIMRNKGCEFYDEYDPPNLCNSFYPYNISIDEKNDIFKNIIIPNLKIRTDIKPLDPDILVIHIRSGDAIIADNQSMFHESVPGNLELYRSGTKNIIGAQPPAIAYEKLIPLFRKVIIVAENNLNPCINYLANKYPDKVSVQMGTLIEDVELILSAQNLAFSSIYHGTFIHNLVYLSKNLKNAFVFEHMKRENYKEDYKYKDINTYVMLIDNYLDTYKTDNLTTWKGEIQFFKV